MSAWWEEPGVLVPFDTETTGVNPEEDRIVSAYLGDREWLVSIGDDVIPAEATAVHGISTERSREEGEDPEVAVTEMVRALALVVERGQVLVGMNIAFDLTLLDREVRRWRGGSLPHGLLCVDVMVLDKQKDPYRPGSRRLDALCQAYGVEVVGDLHDAQVDAQATTEIARRLLEAGAGRYQPYLLHHLQVQWRWQQQESLAAYFREKGKPYDDVHGYWPVKPRTVRT